MKTRDYFILFSLAILIAGFVAYFQRTPGYMDADYYYAIGTQIAAGKGLTEPFLWNYLDSPPGLPHPAGTYWMPLAGLLAGVIPWLTGKISFFSARIPFIILAGLVPPFTMAMAYSLRCSRRDGWLAGLLALLPGFYLSFLTTTETFSLYMILGSVFLMVSAYRLQQITWVWGCVLGLLAGLLHITRADGLLWLLFAGGLIIWAWARDRKHPIMGMNTTTRFTPLIITLLSCLVSYSIVMAPWYIRNWYYYHSFLSPASGHSLWLTTYNEIVTFPADTLTFSHWASQGIGKILLDRLNSAITNLKSLVGVQGSVFLLPLIIAGAWRLRRHRLVIYGMIAWSWIFIVMSLVFPYAGSRGGFFHSGSAIQPLFWSLAPVGLDTFIQWGVARRGWHPKESFRVFAGSCVVIAFLLTSVLVFQRTIGPDISNPVWNMEWSEYLQIENALVEAGAGQQDGVIVNNPPGYFASTGRWSVVVPEGGLDRVRLVAEKYKTRYLLIEYNHVQSLDELYSQPHDFEGFSYLRTVGTTQIYRRDPD